MAPKDKQGFYAALDISGIIATYGVFLIAGGAWGAMKTGAMHALYGGLAGGALIFFCYFLTSFTSDRKCVAAGVHLDLLLAAVFTVVFGLQSYKAYGVPAKMDRFPLFVILGLGSICHIGAMMLKKPRKDDK